MLFLAALLAVSTPFSLNPEGATISSGTIFTSTDGKPVHAGISLRLESKWMC